MFAQARSPEQLTPSQLDAYLEQGWFRMGQTIFTTNFVRFQRQVYSTIWLRVFLSEYQPDQAQIKLFKRNAIFRSTIQPAILTPEKEELYLRYQQSLPFPTSESLRHLLLGDSDTPSIYTTYEATVYDGTRLIAIGFFDVGETSAEGIVSVYDPAYKKYSLGKYLIYQKMKYCQHLKLHYFYPGYFVPGNSYFDYKLSIGRPALQFLQLCTQHWLGIGAFSEESIPYSVMHTKLLHVQKLLEQAKLESRIVNYEFFDANLLPALRESELFDFPVFLFCEGVSAEDRLALVVFNASDSRYHLFMCVPFWKPDIVNPDTAFYSSYVLKTIHELHATSEVEEMVAVFLRSAVSRE